MGMDQQGPTSAPKPRIRLEKVAPGEFERALARVSQYMAQGKSRELADAIAGRLSMSTLKLWLANPERARRGNQAPKLLEVISDLPPLAEEHVAYAFLADQLQATNQIAILQHFQGAYEFRHNFADSVGPIHTMRVLIDAYEAVTFAFRYKSISGQKRLCDGFVWARNERIIFYGLSPTTIFSCAVSAPGGSILGPLFGNASLEDIDHPSVAFGRVALLPRAKFPWGNKVEAEVDEYLGKKSVPQLELSESRDKEP
jgi:hypothetical protein